MGASAQLDISGAKGGQKQPKAPVEAPDSLQSTNIAKLLLAVGEGEFDGTPTDQDIYLDNTPIKDANGNVNFPGVKWEWRSGSVEQEYIQGIPAVENETTVGLELRSDNPFSRALSDIQLSAVRVRLAWPRLLKQESNGNTNGYRIEYAIDIATDGGAYVEAHRGAVDGKTNNGYQRSVRVNLPKASDGWMLRVRRITPNANSGTVADTMTIAGYTEIIDQKLRYPNTALLYIEFDAQQFQNIPAVTVNCKARRWPVPSNYDPIARTYSGIWDGTFKQAWTNNPALVTYGLCVEDRFGLGKRIKPWMVDKWEMYRIAQYCDQRVPDGIGGEEPRFLCDLNLQGRAEAWTLLRDLSAIYRGMVYWAHGALFMQADMPRAQDIDYVFTRANVIDGDFVYGGAERNTHYSRALVSYDNPANNYDTDVIPVTDQNLQRRYRDRPVEISAIACTRASEAQRRGKWALLSNNQDRTVTFRTGMEGRIPLPGFVIPVADELVAGRPNGGRISAVSGRVITLDRDTPVKPGDRLIINLPNGTAQARTVQTVNGRAVTVTTAYGVQPEPQLQWAIDYADLAVQLFRVLKTTRTQQGDFEITALEFNPSKFAAIDTGAKLDERPISVIPVTTVQPPASVTLSASHMIDQGIAVNTMTIAWDAVQGAVGYDVEWRKDNGNWVRLQRTGATSVDVIGIYAGAYLARVRAVSAFDISSIWKNSVLTQLTGKQGLPPAITGLTAQSQLFGIGLKWTFPAGAEDTQRTELWYSQGTDLGEAAKLADLAYPQNEHVLQGLRAGQRFYFWARLVDKSDNVGPWYPSGSMLVTGMSSADAGPILEQIKDQITESELGKELTSKIEKIALIDGNGPGSVNERLGTARTELAKQISDVNNALGTTKGNLQQQITAVSADVSAAKTDLQQQIASVSVLAGSLPYRKDKAYSTNQSALGSDGKLYQALKAVPLNTPPPNASYWTDVGQAVVTAAGTAARVSKLETDVSTLDGKTTAQASQISGLQAGLSSTNDNVTKKADASAVSSLGLRVSDAEGTLSSQAKRLDGMQTSIDGKASSQALQQVTSRVTATEQKDAAQDQQLSSQSQALTSLTDSVSKKADASSVQSLSNTVAQQGQSLTAQGQSLTRIDTKLLASQDNSPTKVYQSVFSDMAQDQWVSTYSGSSASAWFGVPAGITRGAALILDGGSGNKTWWGASTRKIRFDPTRLYKLTLRMQQVAMGTGAPGIYAGIDCYAEDGKTRINTQGASSVGSSHYVLLSNRKLSQGEWATVEVYVKGHTTGSEGGAAGAGTLTDPKRLKEGTAWFSPMVIAGYSDVGGQAVVDYFDIEDATEQVLIDAGATATTALAGRVEKTEQGLSSVSSQTTQLSNSLTTTNQNLEKAQQAAQAASTLAGSKGKTLVQASAPATSDRQEQNLWIDTTGNANTPKRWTGTAWVAVTDKVATDAAAAAANALSKVGTKADASTVQSLSNKVEQQGTAITAAGEAIIGITASLAQVGGENLLPNPSFELEGSTAGLADGWRAGGLGGSSRTLSLVPSTLDPRGRAQRVDAKGLSGSAYVDIALPNPSWVSMAPGQVLTVSAHVRGTQDLVSELYLQYKSSSGATLGTHGPLRTTLSDTWTRPVFTGAPAPAGTIGADLLLRVRGPLSGVVTDGYYEIDRAQAELSSVVSAWKDNAKNAENAALANASAISGVSGRVSKTEEGLTSFSGQLTQLDNSLGDIGGENLLYNPSFMKAGAATGNNPDGWLVEGPATNTPSLVTSWLNAAEKAFNCNTPAVGGVNSGNPYVSLVTASERAPSVAAGQTVTSSVYVRKSPDSGDLGLRIFHQWFNSAGVVISAPASSVVGMTTNGARQSFTSVAPANAVRVRVYLRAHAASGSTAAGTFELARPQVEYGSRATGWRDNGQLNSNAIGGVSTAVEGLTSSVSQQGKDITSVSGRTTSLENSVNSPVNGLATKASTSALSSIAGRVTATEQGLSSQVQSTTALTASIKAANSAGSNTIPNATFDPAFSQMGFAVEATVGQSIPANCPFAYAARLGSRDHYPAVVDVPFTAVKPGDVWRLSALVACQSGTAPFSHWIQSGSGPLVSKVTLSGGGRVSPTATWTRTVWDYVVPAGVFFIRPFLQIEQPFSGGTVWYATDWHMEDVSAAKVAQTKADATASALSSTQTTVNQQGSALKAESQRVDDLYTSVGNTNAAVQTETKARSDADSALSTRITTAQAKADEAAAAVQSEVTARANADTALGKRVDTVQSNLGNTSASVQQISTAQTGMKNMLNAQYTLRVQVNNQYGVHHWGGFGIGINEQRGVVQSAFVIYADQFVLLNSNGAGLSSPFSVVGGQTFIADAYIRDASIGTAKIANGAIANAQIQDAAITNSKIGDLQVDTLKIGNEAVTIPRYAGYAPRYNCNATWQTPLTITFYMPQPGMVYINYCSSFLSNGTQFYQYRLVLDGNLIAESVARWSDSSITLAAGQYVGAGQHTAEFSILGATGVVLSYQNLMVQGIMK